MQNLHALNVEQLYKEHHHWLNHWFCSQLTCSHQAADLAHDTFLRVLIKRHHSQQKPIQQPRAFLQVIARGILVDHYRKRAVERSFLEALATLPEAFELSVEEKQILLQTLQQIDAILETLPDMVRKAFLRSQLDGLTYLQIADEMNISVRTVKRYMQQGFSRCLATMM